jgi:hypothetical protein
VPRTFQAPRSYDPSFSLLGRALRAWTGDRLRGEALYIVVLTGMALALLMSHYLGWALLRSALTSQPSWQIAFWAGQLGTVVLWAAVGLVGVRPGVAVTCTEDTLTLTQAGRTRTVSPSALDEVRVIAASRFHRHYRRYAATDAFVSAVPDEVVLLRTDDGPVVVALPSPDDQAALLQHLDAMRTPTADAAVPSPS